MLVTRMGPRLNYFVPGTTVIVTPMGLGTQRVNES
jgi:hypothetical protein